MATGHINPGYGNIVSKLRRAQSAGNSSENLANYGLIKANFESIRQNAKDAWLKNPSTETSYQDHFRERRSLEPTFSRPTSPTRRNKPHPPLVFLTCALHNVPGYHDPDSLYGKDPNKVDALLPPEERLQRAAVRQKHLSNRPSTAALYTYSNTEVRQNNDGGLPSAWRPNVTSPDSIHSGGDNMDSVLRRLDMEQNYDYNGPMIASHHRYLKPAGHEEALYLTGQGQTLGTLRATDRVLKRENRAKFGGRTKRGDFLLHPEWGPHFSHHRLNGLSPGESKYTPPRRIF